MGLGRHTRPSQTLVRRTHLGSAERAKTYGLLRNDVEIDSWFEPKYLTQALNELHLQDYWPRYDADGKKVATGTVEQTQAATQ